MRFPIMSNYYKQQHPRFKSSKVKTFNPSDSFKSSKVQAFNRILFGILFLALEHLNPLNLERALAQAPFYQGKTIRVIVGYQPGGLTLGSIGGALFMAQLTGRKEVQFDWPKYSWIMTPERGGHLLFMRTDAPIKNLDELRQTNDPPKCSATGVGSTGYDIPRLLEEALGFKFRVISGYPGGAEQDLAMERNEVQCRAITIDGFFGREPFRTWMKNGFVRVLLQTEQKRHPKLPNVPTVFELMDQYKVAETKRRLVNSYLGIWGFGSRPIVSTPAIPADRLKILREAFMKMFKDTEVLDEMKKKNWEVAPVAGEELEALAKEVVDQPPEVTAALKRILSK